MPVTLLRYRKYKPASEILWKPLGKHQYGMAWPSTLKRPLLLSNSVLLRLHFNMLWKPIHNKIFTQLRNTFLTIKFFYYVIAGFPGGSVVKNPPAMQKTWVWSLGQEDLLEKEVATYSSILAWERPRTEEHGGLQSMGSQKSWTWLSDQTASYKATTSSRDGITKLLKKKIK